MVTLSVCMIVKNEEKVLARCLDSVKDVADEIIVVDTGSSDGTKDIAKKYTDKIFDFAWRNDFSLARNESLKHAACDWILVIDADEIIENANEIKRLIQLKTVAYTISTHNYTNDTSLPGFRVGTVQGYAGYHISKKVRLFKNHIGIQFIGVVHEIVEASIKEKVKDAEGIVVNHFSEPKVEFYLGLAEEKVKQQKDNSQAFIELGVLYRLNNQIDKAIQALHRSIELDDSAVGLYNLGSAYLAKKDYANAQKYFHKTLNKKPKSSDAMFGLGVCAARLNDMYSAKEFFRQAIEANPENINARNNLGVVLEKLDYYEDAIEEYNTSIEILANNPNAYFGLAVALVKKEKTKEAIEALKMARKFNHPKRELINKMIIELSAVGQEPTYEYQASF